MTYVPLITWGSHGPPPGLCNKILAPPRDHKKKPGTSNETSLSSPKWWFLWWSVDDFWPGLDGVYGDLWWLIVFLYDVMVISILIYGDFAVTLWWCWYVVIYGCSHVYLGLDVFKKPIRSWGPYPIPSKFASSTSRGSSNSPKHWNMICQNGREIKISWTSCSHVLNGMFRKKKKNTYSMKNNM